MSDMFLEATPRQLTNDDVYKVLRNDILKLKIQPGEALSENYVANRFNISRTPVRSIFVRLARDGLLDVLGRKGTFVSLIDLDMAEQIIFMRIHAELAVMAYIANHPDNMLFKALRQNLEKQNKLLDTEVDDEEFYRIDSQFHGLCMASMHKQKLWKMIQSMDVHYSRYRHLDYTAARSDNVFNTLYLEHSKLYELMAKGRAEEIRYALTAHLYGGILRINTRLATEYHTFFTDSTRSIEEILLDVKLTLREALGGTNALPLK